MENRLKKLAFHITPEMVAAGKLVGTGLAVHTIPNLVSKTLSKTEVGKSVASTLLAKGIEHGLNDKQIHPILQSIGSRVLGPEIMAPYVHGREFAKNFDLGAMLSKNKDKKGDIGNIINFMRSSKAQETAENLDKTFIGSVATRAALGAHSQRISNVLDKLPTVGGSKVLTRGQNIASGQYRHYQHLLNHISVPILDLT